MNASNYGSVQRNIVGQDTVLSKCGFDLSAATLTAADLPPRTWLIINFNSALPGLFVLRKNPHGVVWASM